MYSERLSTLPPYLFADIDRAKGKAIQKGIDMIDLSVGDPDLPTAPHIIEALYEAAKDRNNHRYPSYAGMLGFREAVAAWYKKVKNVRLDPQTEVLTLIGSKEGIAHTPFAFLNPGDITLVPDPSYPVYANATILADGKPHYMPLLRENDFLPDLGSVSSDVAKKAKLMFLNYPNNPTTATADSSFFKDVVDFARDNDIIVCHDNPYSEMTYDGYRAPSFLEVDGSMEVGIEFHSVSKIYNMTGWRLGYAVGNRDIIGGLGRVKTNIDSGTFQAVQIAGITALTGPQDDVQRCMKIYEERRNILYNGLRGIGLDVDKPRATFYLWSCIPEGSDSIDFSKVLLEKCGIVTTPGVGFGKCGEGYVRFALTEGVDRIKEAIDRMKSVL